MVLLLLTEMSSFLPVSGHEKSGSKRTAKIAVCLHGVVTVQRGNGIEQCRQEVGFCISHLGMIIPDAVADTLNVHGCDSGEPILNIGSSVFRIPANTNSRAAIHGNLQHDLHKLIDLLPAVPIPHNFILNLLSNPFSFCPSVCQRSLSVF